jgi:hypothetical protein
MVVTHLTFPLIVVIEGITLCCPFSWSVMKYDQLKRKMCTSVESPDNQHVVEDFLRRIVVILDDAPTLSIFSRSFADGENSVAIIESQTCRLHGVKLTFMALVGLQLLCTSILPIFPFGCSSNAWSTTLASVICADASIGRSPLDDRSVTGQQHGKRL